MNRRNLQTGWIFFHEANGLNIASLHNLTCFIKILHSQFITDKIKNIYKYMCNKVLFYFIINSSN